VQDFIFYIVLVFTKAAPSCCTRLFFTNHGSLVCNGYTSSPITTPFACECACHFHNKVTCLKEYASTLLLTCSEALNCQAVALSAFYNIFLLQPSDQVPSMRSICVLFSWLLLALDRHEYMLRDVTAVEHASEREAIFRTYLLHKLYEQRRHFSGNSEVHVMKTSEEDGQLPLSISQSFPISLACEYLSCYFSKIGVASTLLRRATLFPPLIPVYALSALSIADLDFTTFWENARDLVGFLNRPATITLYVTHLLTWIVTGRAQTDNTKTARRSVFPNPFVDKSFRAEQFARLLYEVGKSGYHIHICACLLEFLRRKPTAVQLQKFFLNGFAVSPSDLYYSDMQPLPVLVSDSQSDAFLENIVRLWFSYLSEDEATSTLPTIFLQLLDYPSDVSYVSFFKMICASLVSSKVVPVTCIRFLIALLLII
jgi:hypothetical protein